ncbi:sulfonate ABC transporter permease, partial [Achromobacter xylosoxidans]
MSSADVLHAPAAGVNRPARDWRLWKTGIAAAALWA